ncbi:hypothetical protein D9M69_604460 [compost metagenome]
MPAVFMRSMRTARENCPIFASSNGSNSCRCFERSVLVANFGSTGSSGQKITSSQNFLNWPLLPTAITTGPSAASNTP